MLSSLKCFKIQTKITSFIIVLNTKIKRSRDKEGVNFVFIYGCIILLHNLFMYGLTSISFICIVSKIVENY